MTLAPRPSLGSVDISDIDNLMMSMHRSVQQFKKALESKHARTGEALQDTVKFKRGKTQVLESLVGLRRYMDDLLRRESGVEGRPELVRIFGDDGCSRIAAIHSWTQLLNDAGQGSSIETDSRLTNVMSLGHSVEEILTDLGLGKALKLAKQEAKEKLQAEADAKQLAAEMRRLPRNSVFGVMDVRDGEYSPTEEVVPEMHSLPPCIMNTTKRLSMVSMLDKAESARDALEIIDTLFDVYDHDASGSLSGEKYDLAIRDFTAHVHKEASERHKRLGWAPPDWTFVENWVTELMDPNLDGEINREEAQGGFKKAVDDIDD